MKDLEREETNGYWRTSLEVSVGYVSSVAKTQSADADPYGGPPVTAGLRGGSGGGSSWVWPGDRVGDAYDVEYWRFLLPSESVNFCHNLGYAEILLPSLIGYDGTINWSIEPDGPGGTGNPIILNPSELDPGAYEITVGIETLEGTLEKTITLNVRALSLTSTRLVVDATDTSTHYLPIDGNGTFIPDDDDFVVISVPEGIDSIDFIPADLDPGTTYVVDVWNGDCGYQTVEVVAVEMKVEPLAEWPKGIRSDLGVGEILDCSVKPPNLTVLWSCTTGKAQFASPNSSSTTLRVLDVPGSLTVTASIEGVALSTNYVVHAPEGIAYSEVGYVRNNNFGGCAGVGGQIIAVVSPTNVSFDNVWLQEEYCEAFATGWFAANNYLPPHDINSGAWSPKRFEYMPTYGFVVSDYLDSGNLPTWGEGELIWEIPVKWWIVPDSITTNFHTFHYDCTEGWRQVFRLYNSGTTTVEKFGSTIRRTLPTRFR